MTDYAALYTRKLSQASIDYDVKAARALLAKFGTWIDRYRGGLPAGWMAAIMLWESGGNFDAPGDVSLGEAGYYQIAAYVPPLFGLPASARMDPETNVCIACLEYALEAVKFARNYPEVKLGTADSWKLARLVFAIGRGGSYALANAARPLRPGDVYGSIRDHVAANGGVQLGSQSPMQIWFRVMTIDLQWRTGQTVASGSPGMPTVPPQPPKGPFTIPAADLPFFAKPIQGTVLILGLLGLGGLAYLYMQR